MTRAAATRAVLGLVLAATFAGGAAHAQADTYTNHKPLSQITPATAYSSHKPLRANHPGSYASNRSAPGAAFDWIAAGVGAAGMLGLVLLVTAARAGVRRTGARDTPLVLEVRDDRPGMS